MNIISRTNSSTIYMHENGVIKEVERTSRALREISLLKAMNHPQIIKLNSFSLGSLIKLRMPLVTKIPDDFPITEFYKQCLHILTVLESYQIVHLDFRYENLGFLDNKIILLDFGHAFLLGTNNLISSSNYPLEYIRAPEISSSFFSLVDTKVDLWSLGIITYHKLYDYYPGSKTKLTFPEGLLGEDLKVILQRKRPLASQLAIKWELPEVNLKLKLPTRSNLKIEKEEFFRTIGGPSALTHIEEEEAYTLKEHIERALNIEPDLIKLSKLYAHYDTLGDEEILLFEKLECQLYSIGT